MWDEGLGTVLVAALLDWKPRPLQPQDLPSIVCVGGFLCFGSALKPGCRGFQTPEVDLP